MRFPGSALKAASAAISAKRGGTAENVDAVEVNGNDGAFTGAYTFK
jgi:hypothetical protein